MLTNAGYSVDLRTDHVEAEFLDHEGRFDLIILALHGNPEKAALYSDRLSNAEPQLPILLLTDFGVFVPSGTLSRSVETGDPAKLIRQVAAMLEGSSHVRELSGKDLAE